MSRNTVFNKYKILGKLGAGGMSRVYLSYDIFLKKKWAIKIIDKSDRYDYLLEARIMRDLNHPLLPRIVEIFEDSSRVYIVMDYIEGISLSYAIKKKLQLDNIKIAAVFRELSDILEYLHSRKPAIIHGDIKPGNIILTDTGARLIDFGTALRDMGNCPGNSYGSRGYIAPEILTGSKKNIKSDIYSLGMCMYAAVNNRLPDMKTKGDYRSSYFLCEIIEKCICNNPKERYGSMGELKKDLIKSKTLAKSNLNEKPYNIISSGRRTEKKIKYRIYFKSIIIFFILTIFSAIFFIGNIIKNSEYEKLIFALNTTAEIGERENIYSRIIEKYPKDTEVYFLIIRDIKEDLCFTEEEERFLMMKLNDNLNNIKDSKNYGQLIYSIARLYWFYYDDKGISGKISAVFWFDRARNLFDENSKEYREASVCAGIGELYRDINSNIKEHRDKGIYGSLFVKLEGLWEISESDNELIAGLEAVRIYCGLVNAHCEDFLRENIDKGRMEELYRKYNLILINNKYNDKDLIPIKEELKKEMKCAENTINRIYREEGNEL